MDICDISSLETLPSRLTVLIFMGSLGGKNELEYHQNEMGDARRKCT